MIERLNQLLSRLIHAHALDHLDHLSQGIHIGLFHISCSTTTSLDGLGLSPEKRPFSLFWGGLLSEKLDHLDLVGLLSIHLNGAIRTHLNISLRQLNWSALSHHGIAHLGHQSSTGHPHEILRYGYIGRLVPS